MSWEAWLTLVTLVAIAYTLLRDLLRPDFVFLGALGILLVTGVLTPAEAFAGFSNTAVIAVGALFIVAAGIEETGALRTMERALLGSGESLPRALLRLMVPTAAASAVVNNTPVVAILMQPAQKWANRHNISASKVLIPLSYAAIAGGMTTLMGTSTNVIVAGITSEMGYGELGLFAFTPVGLASMVVVLAYMLTIGHRLLPERASGPTFTRRSLRACLFEVRVASRSSVVGQNPIKARLWQPGNAVLVYIRRDGYVMTAEQNMVIAAGDVLGYSGDVEELPNLLRRSGLEPGSALGERGDMRTLPLYEAVIADTSNLVGKTLREVQFPANYGAVVLAVQRTGGRLAGAMGRTPLTAGDLLLVGALPGFEERWLASHAEFYYVAPRANQEERAPSAKPWKALTVLAAMVAVVAFNLVALPVAAFLAAIAMVGSGCLTLVKARKALDLQVLMLIAAALGVGQAFTTTGLTAQIADLLAWAGGSGPIMALICLYICTNILTELIATKATAVLMLPAALALADGLGVNPMAFAIAVAVGAAASFMTPVGYPTNLMVMAAGKYRVRDYIRVGAPMSLLVMIASTAVISFLWL